METPTRNDDDLLSPSLEGRRAVRPAKGSRPWRLGSQFYVAFFGGALAATVIAWLNSGRLGLEAQRRRLIPLVGLAAVVAEVVALALLVGDPSSREIRFSGRVAGVAAYGALYWLQRPVDRLYHATTEGDDDDIYDSLWVPGLIATFVLGTVQALVVLGLVELF